MSRIFDALKKTEAQRPAPAETQRPAPASVTPIPAPPGSSSMLRAAPASSGETRAALGGPLPIVKSRVTATLPDDVQREMGALRVALESALEERGTRVVAFVSSQGGEGTSTVAAQFVLSLVGDTQARALLIDIHARRPAVGVAGGPLAGLFEFTAEASERGPMLEWLAIPEDAREAGQYSATELRARLDRLGDQYDWVVLDGPPVLFAADAGSLGAVADGVVLVVESGRTKKPVLSRSVDLLRKAGARILGSVLNRRRLEIPEFIYRRI